MELADRNRLFIALDPAPDARAELAALSHELCRMHGGRALPAENLHVTLAFLGQVEPRHAGKLAQAVAATVEGPHICARGVELVPRPGPRRASLLALSLADDEDRLTALIAQVQIAAARALGRPDPDTSALWPHITLGRFRPPIRVDVRATRDHLTQRELVFAFDRASLYNSDPNRRGPPQFRALATFEFD